ncbi:MAG: hypothetical protein GY739_07355 [Mesoflavibacter sp.]|nr:hypothetical protein [Mesoflavibacter sp.]
MKSNLNRLLRVSDKKNSKNKTKKLSLTFLFTEGFSFIIAPKQNKPKAIEDMFSGISGNESVKGKIKRSNFLNIVFINFNCKSK